MKRLIGAIAILAVLVMGTTATAKLTGGDKGKIKKWLAVYLDVKDDDRDEARADLIEFLSGKRKVKELKDVATLGELIAGSAVHESKGKGKVESKQWALKDLDLDPRAKFPYVVSVPKKYNGSERSEPWPLILCLPDKGETAEDYMEKYWKSSAIRAEYLIIVLGYGYGKVQVEKQRTVEEDKGGKIQVRIETYKEKVPFSWTNHPERVYALQRFWGSMAYFQMMDYKIDPNRIIVDGHGFGADGAMYYAAGSAWRFAGMILRGGAFDRPTISNLAHLPVLTYPAKEANDATTKTLADLKGVLGDLLVAAGAEPEWSGGTADGGASLLAWLGNCRRNRYPLPSKWVRTDPAERTGYWLSINETFTEEPAEATVSADRKKARIDITTVNVGNFDLYLNDLLIDLDKEFELFVNEESRGKFKLNRSAEQLISHLMSKSPRDLGCVFTAELPEIVIAAPPKPDDGDAEKKDGDAKDGDKKDADKKDGDKKDGDKKDAK